MIKIPLQQVSSVVLKGSIFAYFFLATQYCAFVQWKLGILATGLPGRS